jgi:hypothetical protein
MQDHEPTRTLLTESVRHVLKRTNEEPRQLSIVCHLKKENFHPKRLRTQKTSQPTLLSAKIPDSGTLKKGSKFQHVLIQQKRCEERSNANLSALTPWRAFHSLSHHCNPYSQWQNRWDAAVTVYPKLSQKSQQSNVISNE